jgi:F0F1-type ATP synthase membrane subunit b/b'
MIYRTKHRFAVSATALALLSLSGPALAAEPVESGASPMTLVFYAINFVVFVLLLARYAGGSVKNYFSLRARTIFSAFANLEGALREARAQAARAAARVGQLASEKARIEALIHQQTEQEVEAIRQGARSLAAQIRRDAEVAARSVSEKAVRQFRATIARRTAHMAREMLRDHLRPADQRHLVENFVQQMAGPEAR